MSHQTPLSNGVEEDQERTFLMRHYSRELRETIASQLGQHLINRSEIRVLWLETKYNLFLEGKRVWNIQKIFIDDLDDWDGNLKLVLVKEKLGLVQYHKVSTYHGCGNMDLDLMCHRMSMLVRLIPKERLCTYDIPLLNLN